MKYIIIVSLFLISCSMDYRFNGPNDSTNNLDAQDPQATTQPDSSNSSQNNPQADPVLGVDPDTGDPITTLKFETGDCSPEGVQILSCFNCKVKTKVIQAELSTKAKQLIAIMKSACRIKNKSDPNGKALSSESMIFNYLSGATQERYPDTVTSSTQEDLLNELANPASSRYQTLFGGLWYQPTYSTDFETYFGVSTQEAKSLFCYQTESTSFGLNSFTPLQSKSFIDCQNESPYTGCNELPEYIAGNKIREQLQNSINYSLKNPFQPGQMIPINRCQWESAEGTYGDEFEYILVNWVNKGYRIGIYFEEVNPRCEPFKALNSEFKGRIKAGAYICDNF